MITALVLTGYAIGTASVTRMGLTRAGWTRRSPRLALTAWLTASCNVVISATLAGVALAAGVPHPGVDPYGWLELCLDNMRDAYTSPLDGIGWLIGMGSVSLILGRLFVVAVRTTAAGRRTKVRVQSITQLAGRQGTLPGVTVLDHHTACAFCVPGRGGRIVLTSAAMELLGPDEFAAVLAHEKAHLRGRHHALVTCSRVLATAFPWLRIFRDAERETAHLVELLADDQARRHVGARHLADALHSLAQTEIAAGALAASAVGVSVRLARLSEPAPEMPRGASLAVASGIFLTVLLPLVVAAAPAVNALIKGLCATG